MSSLNCTDLLTRDSVSQAFKNRLSDITDKITSCLYQCFLKKFKKWAVITYPRYPQEVVEDLAEQSFTDGVLKFSENASQGFYDGNATIKTIFFSFYRLQLLSKLQQEDRLREKQRKLNEYLGQGAIEDKAQSLPDVKEILYDTLYKALQEMEPTDRRIILWRHLEQKPNDEIARLLGITVPAATNRIHRCMKRVRKIIENTKEAE